MKLFQLTILLLSIFAAFAALPAAAQETGGAKGKVRTIRNQAIGGVNVTVTQNGKDVKSSTTNNKGEFLIDGLKPGTYDFTFRKDGFNTGTMKNVEVGKKNVRNLGNGLVLEADDGSLVIIKGVVFDEEGRSIPGADVLVEKILGDNNFQKLKTTHTSFGQDVVDRGEFTFKLPEGEAKYRVTATFRGISASKEVSVDIAAVYRTAITLTMQKEKEQ